MSRVVGEVLHERPGRGFHQPLHHHGLVKFRGNPDGSTNAWVIISTAASSGRRKATAHIGDNV